MNTIDFSSLRISRSKSHCFPLNASYIDVSTHGRLTTAVYAVYTRWVNNITRDDAPTNQVWF